MKPTLSLFVAPFALSLLLACSSSDGGGSPGTLPNGADAGATSASDSGPSTAPFDAAVAAEAGKSSPDAASIDAASIDAAPSPTVSCSANGGGCTCIVESSGSSAAGSCPAAAMPQPQCCANANYPTTSIAECTCQNYACNDLGAGLCMCGLDSTGTAKGAACTGTYAHCCFNTTTNASCTCGLSPCASGDTEVSSCTTDILQCGPLTARVASCR
jgi:hypothetical protein